MKAFEGIFLLFPALTLSTSFSVALYIVPLISEIHANEPQLPFQNDLRFAASNETHLVLTFYVHNRIYV